MLVPVAGSRFGRRRGRFAGGNVDARSSVRAKQLLGRIPLGKADAAVGSKFPVRHDPFVTERDQVERRRPIHGFFVPFTQGKRYDNNILSYPRLHGFRKVSATYPHTQSVCKLVPFCPLPSRPRVCLKNADLGWFSRLARRFIA
jgi:hypothetical protein